MNVTAVARSQRPMNFADRGRSSRPRSRDSFAKLDPRVQFRNPVMFVVFVGSIFTTLIGVAAAFGAGRRTKAIRSSCSRSRPGSGSRCCSRTSPRRSPKGAARRRPRRCARCASTCTRNACSAATATTHQTVEASALKRGDLVLVRGRTTSSRPTARSSKASPRSNESAVTGESAPVLREAGGDFSRRHRRHARAVRLARRARHEPIAGEALPRPHDRDGRGREARRARRTRSRSRSCSRC